MGNSEKALFTSIQVSLRERLHHPFESLWLHGAPAVGGGGWPYHGGGDTVALNMGNAREEDGHSVISHALWLVCLQY